MAKKKHLKNKSSKKKNEKLIDERLRIVLGFFFISFTLLSFFAFVSYLFTWQNDQSIAHLPISEIIQYNGIPIKNWAGKLGVLLAALFIHKWFGVASFGFLVITLMIGLRLLRNRPFPIFWHSANIIMGVVLLSVYLGYFFGDNWFILGGGHGYFINLWLSALIGKAGTMVFLLFLTISFLAYRFNPLYKKILNSLQNTLTVSRLDKKKSGNTLEQKEPEIVEPSLEQSEGIHDDEFGFDDLTNTNTTTLEENEKEEESKKDEPDFEVNQVIEEERGQPVDSEDETEKQQEFVAEDTRNEISLSSEEIEFETSPSVPEESFDDNLLDINVKYKEDSPGQSTETSSSNKTNGQDEEPEAGIGMEVESHQEETVNQNRSFLDIKGKYDPKLDLEHYKLPALNLLPQIESKNKNGLVSQDELQANKNKIVETLANYNIKIEKIKATIGPTVTLYEIIPAPGIRISKIKNLEDDIALSLAALGIRIIAPMPGKGTVGIEVPNSNPEVVSIRSVLASRKFQESDKALPIAMGKTITNETHILDLTKMPHLLIAGATGQGKSVGLNVILASLLYKKHPAELKLVLIDPKKVELSLFNNIDKHFLAQIPDADEPIITDTQKVINTLNSLTIEMDERYELLKMAHAKNIKEYNKKFTERKLNPMNGHQYLPYIVVIIDEFADLIMTAGKEIEMPLARLAQLARAIGIHLVIATQRPTTNIITGVIKANFPSRIAFRVTSGIDSKTILDSSGANQLIGRGDMLISEGAEPLRLQCAFIDTPELEGIVEYIGKQQGYTQIFELPENKSDGGNGGAMGDLEKRDALFEDAARLIVIHQQGSTSLIQRKFSIGYNRAGRIIDQLEAASIVGPFEGSKARQVLVPDEYALEQQLNKL